MTEYKDQTVRIVDLASNFEPVEGVRFENCVIRGPAVLALFDCSLTESPDLGAEPDAIIWEVPEGRQNIVGSIILRGCTLHRCTFEGIGFAVSPADAEIIRRTSVPATKPWSELRIGSNLVRGASGVIDVLGERQVYLERGSRDNQLLLTMNVHDAEGGHVAKLRRNAWAFHDARYDITTHPSSLTLRDTVNDEVVVEASVHDQDSISVDRGHFYAKNGTEIDIQPEYLSVGGVRFSHNVFEGVNVMLHIHPSGLSVG